MYQCILIVPLWNDWSKVTHSQVHGSLMLKTSSVKSLNWISVTIFAELIQFGQDQKLTRPRTLRGEILVFHCFIEERFHISILYIYIYILYNIHIHTHTNLPASDTVSLPHPRSRDSQGQKTFLAPSADKQTHNYDTECSNHHPSLSTLSKIKGIEP